MDLLELRFNPFALPLLLAALISTFLSLYAWRRRRQASAAMLSFLMALLTIWLLSNVMELCSPSLAVQVFWSKLAYFGIATVPSAWFILASQYTGHDRWLTRRNTLLIFIPALLTLLVVFTNEWHGWIWSKIWLEQGLMATEHGWFFWLFSVVAYAQVVVGTGQFVVLWFQSKDEYRWQAAAMVVAAIVPWIGNFLYLSGMVTQFDPTPFGFTVSAIAFAWGLFSLGMFDLAPIARDRVIESMRDGMIVLDAHNRLVDLNPAALRMMGAMREQVVGKMATDLLPAWKELLESAQPEQSGLAQVEIGEPCARRYFDSIISPLFDRRGRFSGRLWMIIDVTRRRNTEEELARAREQIRQLQIEIDKTSQALQVAEITESEYFQQLLGTVKLLRNRPPPQR